MWILLVDDDSLVARVLARSLTRHTSVEVRIAEGLDEALALLRDADSPPLGALLDYDLGGRAPTGVDVLLAIRREGLDVPVALCTGGHLQQVRHRLAGLDEDPPCFRKPIDSETLAQWVLSIRGRVPPT